MHNTEEFTTPSFNGRGLHLFLSPKLLTVISLENTDILKDRYVENFGRYEKIMFTSTKEIMSQFYA